MNDKYNKSERRIRNNRIRRQKEMRRHFLMFIMTFCLVFLFSVSISSFLSKAKDGSEESYYKCYKSITISKEDTLWSIAQEYMDEDHYASIEDYIREVKQTNRLDSNVITYGTYLIIPYYTNEYTG